MPDPGWDDTDLRPVIKFMQASVAEACDPTYPRIEQATDKE